MTKTQLSEILSIVLKQRRTGDNYADGALDMYNAVRKELEKNL
jgi:hypothetical protein